MASYIYLCALRAVWDGRERVTSQNASVSPQKESIIEGEPLDCSQRGTHFATIPEHHVAALVADYM